MAVKKGRARRWILFAVVLLLIGGGAGGWYWYSKREVIISVQTEKAQLRNITELVVANGKIQPVIQVVINPEVSGEIIDLPVKEGQQVKKGDLLVKIKPDNYRATRNSMEATYKSALASTNAAAANLRKAELEYKRVKALFEDNLVSDSQYLEATTTLDVMKWTHENSTHQAEQAAAALARAEDDLAKTTILAPMDGVVTKLRSQRGERVVGTALMAGTEIMTVADLEEMEARVDIGEMDILLIATGQVARLEVDAFRDRKFSGTVSEIANSSKTVGPTSTGGGMSSSSQNQDATKFEVKIRVHEKEIFRPGMSVTAEVETRYRTNVLTVPIQSVTTRMPKKPGANGESKPKQVASAPSPATDAGGKAKKPGEGQKPVEVVFAFDNGRAKMVSVKRGISDDAYVEITDGLDKGMEIVSGGYKAINRDLEDGKKVKIGEPEKDPEKDKR